MTTALFEAAQQIEGSVNHLDSHQSAGDKRKEVPDTQVVGPSMTATSTMLSSQPFKRQKQGPTSAATDRSKALRLEQNRKAARESRRRKKAMIEELQRSLMFFSKANERLKQQNEQLTRQLLDGHNQLASMGKPVPMLDPTTVATAAGAGVPMVSKPAVVVPTTTTPQGMFNTLEQQQPLPVASVVPDSAIDMSMQPGATMQAMATFQQAAHAAMEAASRMMQAHGVVVVHPQVSTSSSTTGVGLI